MNRTVVAHTPLGLQLLFKKMLGTEFVSNARPPHHIADHHNSHALLLVLSKKEGSPLPRCNLFGVIHRADFPDQVDLDVAGIFHFRLDLLGDILGQKIHPLVVDIFRLHHDPHLAAH